MTDLLLESYAGGVRFRVQVKPRARKSEIRGVHGGALRVAVAAPPVDGEANDELLRTLGRALSVPRSALEIVSGTSGRSKLIRVRGVSEAQVRALWRG
jgi:uncharacterized protein (TIGR00251 family)